MNRLFISCLIVLFNLTVLTPDSRSHAVDGGGFVDLSHYLKATIVLYVERTNPDVKPENKTASWGTGFLYGYPSIEKPADGTGLRPWLVTCKHVVEGAQGIMRNERETDFRVRLNKIISQVRGSQAFSLPIQEKNNFRWVFHPTEDVAVMQTSVSTLEDHRVEWRVFHFPQGALTREQIKERDIGEGNQVFILGFPTGWGKVQKDDPREQDHPIVRQGILAQIQGWLRGQESTFLIDGSVFPGNSGGPVGMLLPGSSSYLYLIGMACASWPNVSRKELRDTRGRYFGEILYSENADLGLVIPVEAINETIEEAMRQEQGGEG